MTLHLLKVLKHLFQSANLFLHSFNILIYISIYKYQIMLIALLAIVTHINIHEHMHIIL